MRQRFSRRFLEWILYSCDTVVGNKLGVTDVYWVLNKDKHPWDDSANTFYTLDELYEYWEKHPEIK